MSIPINPISGQLSKVVFNQFLSALNPHSSLSDYGGFDDITLLFLFLSYLYLDSRREYLLLIEKKHFSGRLISISVFQSIEFLTALASPRILPSVDASQQLLALWHSSQYQYYAVFTRSYIMSLKKKSRTGLTFTPMRFRTFGLGIVNYLIPHIMCPYPLRGLQPNHTTYACLTPCIAFCPCTLAVLRYYHHPGNAFSPNATAGLCYHKLWSQTP